MSEKASPRARPVRSPIGLGDAHAEIALAIGVVDQAVAGSQPDASRGYHAGARTVAEAVANHLRSEIRAGRIEPGTRLRQTAVAERLGVSTTPVREAFKLLQAEGVVRVDAHRGAAVLRPTEAEVRELYEIRGALETLAIRRAVNRIGDADFAELERLLSESNTPDGDLAFHSAIYWRAGWGRLFDMIVRLRDASQWGYLLPDALGSHRALLKAIRTGSPDVAAAAIESHLQKSMQIILARLAVGSGEGRPEGPAGGVEPTAGTTQ